MTKAIVHVALVVRDYDEALAFFCDTLHFDLVEDVPIPEQSKRWVVVAPPGSAGTNILLARPSNTEQEACIGNQTGGRVFLFLETTDFAADHAALSAAGVTFQEAPRHEVYGTVAKFRDRFGNLWDLLERSS